MRMNIVKMGCVHGVCDNLLSLTTKWTGPMLCKQRMTADQRIPQNGVKVKGKIGLIKTGVIRYLPSFDIWQYYPYKNFGVTVYWRYLLVNDLGYV